MTNDKSSFDHVMQAINGNMIDDAETAIELASVLIRRRYGEDILKIQQPLTVRDSEEFWIIEGPPNAFEPKTGLGPVYVQLKKIDASVTALLWSPSKEVVKKVRQKRRSPFSKK
jgi:NTF2 fold immunity protein of polymorphic toxin system component